MHGVEMEKGSKKCKTVILRIQIAVTGDEEFSKACDKLSEAIAKAGEGMDGFEVLRDTLDGWDY